VRPPDPRWLQLLWDLGETARWGGDLRERVFGSLAWGTLDEQKACYAAEGRLPGIWFRWVAPAAQCPMSRSPAKTTQNQSHPVSPRPGV
jgi:hypothetical protein